MNRRLAIPSHALLLLVALAAACLRDDSPVITEPDLATAAPGVASAFTILPGTWQLVPGEMRQFVAIDAAGKEIPDPKIAWESLNPAIADFITPSDRRKGILTAQDEGSGQVTIQATVDGATATASVDVVSLSQRLMVIDSTQLLLVSRPPGDAPGEYRFERVGSPDPTVLAKLLDGSIVYIAGDQGSTFFRKVLAASEAGNQIVLDTERGDITKVFPGGGRANGRMRGRLGPRGHGVGCEDPDARGIKCKVPKGQRPVAPASLAAGGDDMTGFPLDLDLCGSPNSESRVQACVSNAHASLGGSFDASVDIDMALSLIPAEFSLIVGGGVAFEVDYEFALAASLSYTAEKEFVLGTTPFSIFGIPGKIEYLWVPGMTVGSEADFALSGRISGGASARGGFICNEAHPQCAPIQEFNTLPFVWDNRLEGEASASVKLFIMTRVKVSWLGIEPFASLGPFFELTGTASEFEHVLDHPTPQLPRLDVGFDFGVEAQVGVQFTILGIGPAVYSVDKSFELGRIPIAHWWAQADGLRVAVTTTGIDLDPDGYSLALARSDADPPVWNPVLTNTVARTGSVTLLTPASPCFQLIGSSPQDCFLVATHHELRVTDVRFNCSLADDRATRHVHLHPYATISEEFAVTCISAYEAVGNTVDAAFDRGQIRSAGVANALRSLLANADEARRAGRQEAADNQLSAFISLVEAQTERGKAAVDGKQIAPDAGVLLIERANLLRTEYLDPPLVN